MLNKGKSINVYDFSGGINVSQPANMIADNECFCDPYNLEGTKNVIWDIGFKKRKGTLLVNETELIGTLIFGVRLYRSEAPQRTTIVCLNTASAVKIYYLDDEDVFQEITGGTAIAADSKITGTVWKDKLYIASSTQVVQVISHTGLEWAKADITGLTYKPAFIHLHKDRLWVAGGDMPEGYLECCDYDDDTSWAGGDGEAFNAGYKEGDRITALKTLGNDLVIYKDNSIWMMKGDNLENWFQQKENESKGCVAGNSIVDIGFGHIFLGVDNLYFFDGTDIAPVGNKIKLFLDMIPAGLKHLVVATYFDNYLRISMPTYTDTIKNSIELLLDLKHFKAGNISWWLNTGRSINYYIPYGGIDDTYSLFACDGSDGYLQQLDIEATDNGSNINAESQTKYFVFDKPNTLKLYDRLFLDTARGCGTFDLEVFRNIENEYVVPVSINTLSGMVTFGAAILGTSLPRASSTSRLKTEIPLPSELDGYSISMKMKHTGSDYNVLYYGFTLFYNYYQM